MATHDLETVTILTFKDGDEEFSRSYDSLLNLKSGDVVNLLIGGGNPPVRAGNYIVRISTIHNQMGIDLEEKGPDGLYKYFDLEYIG
jgi:hypothetical protein